MITNFLSPAQAQQMLIDECVTTSDSDVLATVTRLIPNWWAFYSDKKFELNYWYARRALCMFLKAQARFFIDTQTGPDKVSNNQFFKNADSMLNDANKEIAILDPYRGVPTLGSINAKGMAHGLPDTLREQFQIFERGYLLIGGGSLPEFIEGWLP